MLGLKEKLAAAGVVTADEVKKFDEGQARSRKRRARGSSPPRSARDEFGIDVTALQNLNRGEAYDRIRKVVTRRRLDDGERVIPREEDQVFNFVTARGSLGRLYLEAATIKRLSSGSAAICAYMSHHGLSHCVVEKKLALGIAQVFPLWLRHLKGNPEAGKIDKPAEAPVEDPSADVKE